MFNEISRLAKEIHMFRFGKGTKIDKNKVRKYESDIRIRLEKGDAVPGYNKYKSI